MYKSVSLQSSTNAHPEVDMLRKHAQQRAIAPNDRQLRLTHYWSRKAAYRVHGQKYPIPIDRG